MLSSIFFQSLSLVYIISLAIIYFSKEKIPSYENRIYASLIIIIFFTLVFDIHSVYLLYYHIDSILTDIVSKAYLLFLMLTGIVFTFYVIYISRTSSNTLQEKKEKIFKKGFRYTICLSILLIFVIMIIPINKFSESGLIFTYGPAVDLAYVVIGLCGIIWAISLMVKFRTIKEKKYYPIILMVISVITVVIIQNINPELLLISSAGSFVIFLMYFTIENPDMKLNKQLISANEELAVAKDQAEQANSYKTDFLSSMSHEIRTPLNAIVGLSQALASDNKISEDAKKDVADIITASNILLDIVNGILDISKIEANKLEIINHPYKTQKMLDDLLTIAKARMDDKTLDFRVSFDPAIPEILFGDQGRIKQVLLNLLTNAIKYTKEGYIEFKVSAVAKDGICRLIISIEDSGSGVKPEDIDRLFEKFERINEDGNTSVEGTGLGLAITKRLIELMGGQIVVQSIYGKGSRFTVALNQRIATAEGEKVSNLIDTTALKALNLTNKRILLVDDNKLNLKVAKRLLEKFDLKIDMVESGFDCLEKIEAKEEYDLILLDDMMPKMTGTETLKILREKPDFKIPVVVLTANAISGMREKYLENGFDDYLAKPIEKQELYRVLAQFLCKQD